MTTYNDAKVLITGGLGFIGANLARALVKEGAQVTLVDSLIASYGGNEFNIHDIRDKVTVNICDVRDQHALVHLIKGQDVLFNLAAQTSHVASMSDPLTDLDINARAQLSLLETCRAVNPQVKVVFASTRQLYGRPTVLPVDESHPSRPVDVNGINKLAGESFHLLYNDVYGIRACALRLTNTYGPRMRTKDARQTFLGIWVRCLLEGQPIKVFGDGLQVRDFNYVDDCVSAFLLCGVSESANGRIYNLGSPDRVALKDVAATMVDLRKGGTYELTPFPPERKAIDIGDYYADYSLIAAELGWQPQVSLRDGLRRTIDYYDLYRNHYWANANDCDE